MYVICSSVRGLFDEDRSIQIASIYGLLNIVTRPLGRCFATDSKGPLIIILLGGYMGDVAYQWYGVNAKKYIVLACGVLVGFMSIALGLYIDHQGQSPPSCMPLSFI